MLLLRTQPTRATSCSRTASSAGTGPSLLTTGTLFRSSDLCLRLLQQATATVPWSLAQDCCYAYSLHCPPQVVPLQVHRTGRLARCVPRPVLAPHRSCTAADCDAGLQRPAQTAKGRCLCCSLARRAADFFDSDPVIAEWTPKAEAAAPDGPCRHVDKVEIAKIADRVRIPWTDYETMAISKVSLCQPAKHVPIIYCWQQPLREAACRPAVGSNTACCAHRL